MKKTPSSTPEQIGKPGFVLSQSDENGRFYFACNDINGQLLLLGTEYVSREAANNALQNALRGAKQDRNFQRKVNDDKFYFSLKGNNQKELAHSIAFDTEKELEKAIAFVKQVVTAKNPVTSITEVEETAAMHEKKVLDKPEKQIGDKQKYSFKIDFYNREKGALAGKIEYTHTGQSTSFQGLDAEAIIHFIKKHLPLAEGERATDTPPSASLQLISEENGKPAKLMSKDAKMIRLQLVMAPMPGGVPFDEDCIPASIAISEFNKNKPLFQMEQEFNKVQRGVYQLQMPTVFLQQGIYRVQVRAKMPTVAQTLHATCPIQIY